VRTSPQDWAASTVVPGPGAGTLARFGPVVLLVGSTDPDVVRPYLDHAATVAANGGQGRQLVRGYAMLLSTAADDSPGFAALAAHDTGLAVFVDGDVTVTVDDQVVRGADSLAWAERLVPWPVEHVSVALPGATVPDAASPYRLGDGVVPAGSLLVVDPASAGPTTPSVPLPDESLVSRISEVEELQATEAHPPPAPQGDEASPPPSIQVVPPAVPAPGRPVPPPYEPEHVDFQSVLLDDLDDDEFEPLPIVEDPSQVGPARAQVEVAGVYCKNRHFNDPRQLFCAVCGINMVQQTPVLVNGQRPPLGVVVLDDGSVFQLDGPYLLGRDPDNDERVRSGGFRGLPVIDTSHQVSRVHARLELRGWDVVLVDNHSTNGTFVHVPRTVDWVRMPPGGELVLVQGTRVRIGHRTLAFNTHAGASGA